MPYEFIHKRLKILFSSNFIGYSLVRLSGFWLKANSYRWYIYDPSRDSFFEPPFFGGGSGQEYWSGLPFPYPGDLPYPGIEPRSVAATDHAGSAAERSYPMPKVRDGD